MAVSNDPLVPEQIASQDFGTSFRGFDQAQVRSFLRQLADSVRAEHETDARSASRFEDQSARIAELERQVETYSSEAEGLAGELQKARASFAKLNQDPKKGLPEDLDAGQLTQLLGEETVRVLDSARSAAADIKAKAEKDSDQRTAALDKLQRDTTQELAEKRKATEEQVATLRAEADAEVKLVVEKAQAQSKKLKADATARANQVETSSQEEASKRTEEAATAATAARMAAQDVANAVKQRGEEVAKETRIAAEAGAESVRRSADQVKSDAEAEAARLRAEAAADVETSRDSAREEARLMLTEAQDLREKVLEDLVKRRRVARQQIDQAKAARDRLTRGLLIARKQIDGATAELEVSVPEAKRAMELSGSRGAETEAEQMAVIADGLDQARSKGKTLSPERVADSPKQPASPRESRAKKKALPPKQSSEKVEKVEKSEKVEGVGQGSTVTRAGSVEDDSSEKKSTVQASDDGRGDGGDETAAAIPDPTEVAEAVEDLVVDLDDGGVEAAAGSDLDGIFARIRAEREATPSLTNGGSAPQPAKEEDESGDGDRAQSPEKSPSDRVQSPEKSPSDKSARSKSNKESSSDDSSDSPDGQLVEILAPFGDRDVASTRFGPDLRRKLKRALADDQSDVLDRLRRAKKLSSDDLPNNSEQLSGFSKAAEQGLLGIANAGSASLGGHRLVTSMIAGLLDQLSEDIHGPLRARIERVIAAADGDSDEVLEPVRAHYREVRSAGLPALVDDAIAEAFALGAYEAIANKAKLVWVIDPRTETSPDCFDNTLEDSVAKPEVFPTGHHRPLGGPGCRCLVLPAQQYGTS